MPIRRGYHNIAFQQKPPKGSAPSRAEYPIASKYDTKHMDLTFVDEEKANAISSMIPDETDMHAPVLDIDFPAKLVPSSTPGHFHLYLDTKVPWPKYEKLLWALAEAGIIEQGYAQASVSYRATVVRKPGVKKAPTSPTAWERLVDESDQL